MSYENCLSRAGSPDTDTERMIELGPVFKQLRKLTMDAMRRGDKKSNLAYIKVRDILTAAPAVDAVEVPCKIGDVVWGIKANNHGQLRVKQGTVHQMFFGDDMRLCICVKNVCRGEWGKNVFATKEEAEAATGEPKE